MKYSNTIPTERQDIDKELEFSIPSQRTMLRRAELDQSGYVIDAERWDLFARRFFAEELVDERAALSGSEAQNG